MVRCLVVITAVSCDVLNSYDCDQPFPALSVAKSTAAASCPRQRSFATLVEGTWATFSKEKVSLHPVSAANTLTKYP